jgi:hypothetical protein
MSFTAKAFVISGKVLSTDNSPVEFASVYLAGTTCGTSTNTKGEFNFNVDVAGTYQLVVSHMSYSPYSQTINLSNDVAGLVVRLKEKSKELQAVVVKRTDPYRKENLEIFTLKLLGATKNRNKCTILNPRCLYFYRDPAKNTLKAFADSVLIIRNDALGYLMKYHLLNFYTDKYSTSFSGYIFFEDISTAMTDRKRLSERRNTAYYGSLMHFFRSLYTDSLKKEGFQLFKTVEKPNQKYKPQYLITDKSFLVKSPDYGIMRNPIFIKDSTLHLEQTQDSLDLSPNISAVPNSKNKLLQYDKPFEVDYIRSKEDSRYFSDNSNYNGIKLKNRKQVSILIVKKNNYGYVVAFDQTGNSRIHGEVHLAGYMAWKKGMAEWLPLDFKPMQLK